MKRGSMVAFLLVLFAAGAWGATRKVQYVDTDVVGGTGDGSSWVNAYATLNVWEAQNLNLTTLGGGTYLDVYCRGATADSTAVSISGWTTSATCYINIQCDPNNYHNGLWNTSCYNRSKTTSGDSINVGVSNVILDGIQITGNATAWCGVQQYSVGISNLIIRKCIIKGFTNSSFGGIVINYGTGYVIRNNIIYGCNVGIWEQVDITATATVQNNSVRGTGTGTGILFTRGASKTLTIQNNLVENTTTNYNIGGGGGTLTTGGNYSQDSTSPDVAGRTATITFVNEGAGTENLHLDASMSGTLLGVDLSGTFTTDIDNKVRVKWYAGADELPSGGGSALGSPIFDSKIFGD